MEAEAAKLAAIDEQEREAAALMEIFGEKQEDVVKNIPVVAVS